MTANARRRLDHHIWKAEGRWPLIPIPRYSPWSSKRFKRLKENRRHLRLYGHHRWDDEISGQCSLDDGGEQYDGDGGSRDQLLSSDGEGHSYPNTPESEVPGHLGAVKRHGEKEAQRRNRAVDARRTNTTLARQKVRWVVEGFSAKAWMAADSA